MCGFGLLQRQEKFVSECFEENHPDSLWELLKIVGVMKKYGNKWEWEVDPERNKIRWSEDFEKSSWGRSWKKIERVL